jgi:hypothetical protein
MYALVLLAALGCGNRQKTEGGADAAATAQASTAPEEQAPPPLQRIPPPDSGAETARTGASTERPAADGAQPSTGLGKPVPGLKGLLIPPSTPGAAKVAVEGCLAQADTSEEAGSRFPVPPPTRGPAKANVAVEPLGKGILVVHELAHGCCLTADVKSSLEGRTVTLTETLSGKSCRCRCSSTVRAAVGLLPGDYTLKVVTHEPGNKHVAHEAPLTVR